MNGPATQEGSSTSRPRTVVLVARRWGRRLSILLLAFFLVLCLLLTLILGTQMGRTWLKNTAMGPLNELLPGTVEIKRLARLSPLGIELRQVRVFDPTGAKVLSLDKAAADIDFTGLLSGSLALESLILRHAEVDLRNMTPRRGLIAAFVDPDAPEPPPSTGPPPDIAIEGIAISHVTAQLPKTAPIGQVEARLHELSGDFSLIDGEPVVKLHELRLEGLRDAQKILGLQAEANIAPGAETSRLDLHAQSLGMALDLTAEGVLPTHPEWRKKNVEAALSVHGVTAEHLDELLLVEGLKDAFRGSVDLSLKARGKPEDLTVSGALDTVGGRLQIESLQVRPDSVVAQFWADDLNLSRVREDLPDGKLDFELQVEGSGFPPDPLTLSIRLRGARFDGRKLADLDASGRWSDDRVTDLLVKLTDGASKLSISGQLGLDAKTDLRAKLDLRNRLVHRLFQLVGIDIQGNLAGTVDFQRSPTGKVNTTGDLAIRGARVNNISNEKLDLEFQLSGTFPRLSGQAQIDAAGLSAGETQIDRLELDIEGGPLAYDVRLQGSGGLGPRQKRGQRSLARRAEIDLEAHVKRATTSTHVSGRATGKIAGRALSLDLDSTQILDKGAIETEGIELEIGGQGLSLEGGFGHRKRQPSEGLSVESGPIDLALVAKWLSLPEPIIGTVRFEGLLAGSPSVPQLNLKVRGNGLGLADHPTADLFLEASLDAQHGQAEAKAKITGPQQLAIGLTTSAAFRGGAGYLQRIEQAKGHAVIDVEQLDSESVSSYLPLDALPVTGSVSATWKAHGSLADPHFDAVTNLKLQGEEDRAEVASKLSYHAGHLHTDLSVSDARGSWSQLIASLHLPHSPSALELGEALQNAAKEGRWEVKWTAQPRSIADLPFSSLFLDDPKSLPIAAAARFDARHNPGEEPSIHLFLSATQTREHRLGECETSDFEAELFFSHEKANNQLSLNATANRERILWLSATAEQALLPLQRGAPLNPSAVDFELKTTDLHLDQLPFICKKAKGIVSAQAHGKDVLGISPEAHLEVHGTGLSLTSAERLDLDVLASIKKTGGELKAELQGREEYASSSARLALRLPWNLSQGKLTLQDRLPLDAKLSLHQLPIAPLLPPKGPISYATGTLDGHVSAGGSLTAPELSGELLLNDVNFTATSLAQPLRNVEGHIIFNNRRLRIDYLEAHDRDGKLLLSGHVDLTDLDRVEGALKIAADDFPIRQQGQVVAITNLVAAAHSIVKPNETVARLKLEDVDTWLEKTKIRTGIDLDEHPEFIVDGEVPPDLDEALKERALEKRATQDQRSSPTTPMSTRAMSKKKKPQRVHITIDAQERFWIKRKDFAVKLSAMLETEIVDDEVRVEGNLNIDRGYLQLFGKVFDLDSESELRFIGSSPPNPVLSLRATHQSRGGKDVSVRITGRGNAPELAFFVNESEVAASVAIRELFGPQKSDEDGKDATQQAAAFVSGLTAGVLATAARRELGAAAPIIMIDPGDEAGQGRVRAGFELDEIVPPFLQPVITGVYLEGIVARDDDGETETDTSFGTLLEIYFPKNFFTAGRYGPGSTWSVDLGWRL